MHRQRLAELRPRVLVLQFGGGTIGHPQGIQAGAVANMVRIVTREAHVMAFADVFLVLTALFGALAMLAIFIDKPQARPAGGGGGH